MQALQELDEISKEIEAVADSSITLTKHAYARADERLSGKKLRPWWKFWQERPPQKKTARFCRAFVWKSIDCLCKSPDLHRGSRGTWQMSQRFMYRGERTQKSRPGWAALSKSQKSSLSGSRCDQSVIVVVPPQDKWRRVR